MFHDYNMIYNAVITYCANSSIASSWEQILSEDFFRGTFWEDIFLNQALVS